MIHSFDVMCVILNVTCNVCNIECYKEIVSDPQCRSNVCNIECYKEIVSDPQCRCNVCNI